jgi:hypothetical protein
LSLTHDVGAVNVVDSAKEVERERERERMRETSIGERGGGDCEGRGGSEEHPRVDTAERRLEPSSSAHSVFSSPSQQIGGFRECCTLLRKLSP